MTNKELIAIIQNYAEVFDGTPAGEVYAKAVAALERAEALADAAGEWLRTLYETGDAGGEHERSIASLEAAITAYR